MGPMVGVLMDPPRVAIRAPRAPNGPLLAAVELAALFHELDRLHFHSALERLRLRQALLRGEVAYVLRDLHRAEVRSAHRAEMRELGAFLRKRLVVELLRLVG